MSLNEMMELLHPSSVIDCLVVATAANVAPLFGRKLLGARCAQPIDGGRCWRDGLPLLGSSKTWRGLVSAMLLTPPAAMLAGLPWHAGLLGGLAAMAGDCGSSFIKRRRGLASSSQALGLDQIPEAVLPALALSWYVPVGVLDVVLVAIVFLVGELVGSRLFFRLGLRDRPY